VTRALSPTRLRVLIVEPHADIRILLQLSIRRLGFEPVAPDDSTAPDGIDAILLEPSWHEGQALVRALGEGALPVVCLSIYPREAGLAPPGTCAYLTKPASLRQLYDALLPLSGR
jgi:hypothetical protein